MQYSEIIKSTPTVLVEFFASWCPHCQRMMPVVEQIRELLGSSVDVYQFDIDENKSLASENDVQSIPTFIIYHSGVEKWRHSGEIDGNILLSKIENFNS